MSWSARGSELPIGWLLLVAGLTALVLVLSAGNQLYDTNYDALWEATALLAGDRPYRDFFDWGAPLTGYLSTVAQLAVGYRLIGEFGMQWLLIIAGQVVSFHLAYRLSRSIAASLVTLFLSLLLLVATPTYNYPKLLTYPLALWLAWRYVDYPSVGRAAMLGLATTIAFLLRHDHGVHVACAAALAFALARLARPSSRSLRSFLIEGASYAVTAAATIAPWIALVHLGEGFPQYVQQRAALYENWSVKASPFHSLLALNSPLPTEANALNWLHQITLLVPILLMASVAMNVVRSWRREESLDANTLPTLLAAAVLVLVDDQVVRQTSYFLAVVPITAALAAPLLVWDTSTQVGVVWKRTRAALGIGIVLVTIVMSVAFTRIGRAAVDLIRIGVRPAFVQLLASPPIDGLLSADVLPRVTRDAWQTWDRHNNDKQSVMLRYLHDCTAPGDRVLVTGSTPSQVNYLAERPFAGGHILWHHGWRSDPAHQQQSLTLLQQQSVPFAFSTTDPVLDDFKSYPKIREYLLHHYVELEGSDGMLLIDTRRKPTGTYAALGFPCFR